MLRPSPSRDLLTEMQEKIKKRSESKTTDVDTQEMNKVIMRAEYTFIATAEIELSLEVGTEVVVDKEDSGWYFGHLRLNPEQAGWFPVAYVKSV
jgi:hypothetical protein